MNFLRWVLFLPLALAGATAVNALISFVAKMMLPGLFAMLIGGLFFATAFLIIGFKVVPVANQLSKWLMMVTLLLIGITGTIGSVWRENNEGVASAIGVILLSLAVVRMSPKQLENIGTPK